VSTPTSVAGLNKKTTVPLHHR